MKVKSANQIRDLISKTLKKIYPKFQKILKNFGPLLIKINST